MRINTPEHGDSDSVTPRLSESLPTTGATGRGGRLLRCCAPRSASNGAGRACAAGAWSRLGRGGWDCAKAVISSWAGTSVPGALAANTETALKPSVEPRLKVAGVRPAASRRMRIGQYPS